MLPDLLPVLSIDLTAMAEARMVKPQVLTSLCRGWEGALHAP